MADLGYLRSLLGGVTDTTLRRILLTAFEHVLVNLRLGEPVHQTRAVNFQQYWLQSTTASDTGVFTIAHGLQTTPQYAIPVLELDRPGAQLVPLEVARAADAHHLYLKSPSTSAPILLLVEP